MKKLFIFLFLGSVLTACSLQGNSSSTGTNSPENKIVGTFPSTTLNTDPTLQNQYRNLWLKHVSKIHRGSYYGKTDIWGGGALDLFLWFQDGNLWNSMINVDNKDYVLYYLINNTEFPAQFVDEYTAIMKMSFSASPKLAGSLYIIHISNNTIYRSASFNGFAHKDTWNKTYIPQHSIIEIANRQGFTLSTDMIKNGQDIIYSVDGTSTTLNFTSSSTITELPNNIIDVCIEGTHIYLDQNVIYENENDVITYETKYNGNNYHYTITIINHQITKINTTINTFLGEHIFKGMSYADYVVNINGETPIDTAISEANVSINKTEGDVLWYNAWAPSYKHLIPVDTSKKLTIPNTSYTVNNTHVSFDFFPNGRIKSIVLNISK